MSKLFVAAAGAAIAASALASQPYSVVGGPFTIPDGGGPANPGQSSVQVATPSQVLGITINIQHTWVGDLIMTLDGGANGSVVLMDRPGVPASTFGNSDNFILANMYMWQDGGSTFPETAAGGTVASGTFAPHAGSFAALGQAPGTWTLRISDNAGADVGNVVSWTLKLKKIPAPGAVAVAGLAGLAGLRRRR